MAQLSLAFFNDGRPEYLTIAEAAAELHCHERTIRRAIDRGALRADRIRGANAGRGAWRIRRDDLDARLYAE